MERKCTNCKLKRYKRGDVSFCLNENRAEILDHNLLGQKQFVGEDKTTAAPTDKCDHESEFVSNNV